jgi:hypothetical protein
MIELCELTAGRFVILRHDDPHLHWDFLLEANNVAVTWRLLQQPEASVVVSAVRIAEHRLFYLDYEGPVSGNRGTVARLHSGRYTVQESNANRLKVIFALPCFATGAVLSHSTERGDYWLFLAPGLSERPRALTRPLPASRR